MEKVEISLGVMDGFRFGVGLLLSRLAWAFLVMAVPILFVINLFIISAIVK